MSYSRVFAGLSMASLVGAIIVPDPLPRALLAWQAVSYGSVSIAYFRRQPDAFRKHIRGHLSPLSYLQYGPYLILYGLLLLAFRLDRRHRAYTEIEPGLYLGCRLLPGDKAGMEQVCLGATLDLTAEWPEVGFMRNGGTYYCLPTLDATSPTVDQLSAGARWITEQRDAGKTVYIHCAFGHGRSATILAAYLIYAGKAESPDEAISLLKKQRPGVKLSKNQWAILRQFAEDLSSATKKPPSPQ
jgi:hypothetical protein